MRIDTIAYVSFVSITICEVITQNCFSRDDDEDEEKIVKEVEISESHVERHEEEISEIAVCYDVVDGQPMLKSDKEKECWALFKKMTAKGVTVTFDTVLRFEYLDLYLIIALFYLT